MQLIIFQNLQCISKHKTCKQNAALLLIPRWNCKIFMGHPILLPCKGLCPYSRCAVAIFLCISSKLLHGWYCVECKLSYNLQMRNWEQKRKFSIETTRIFDRDIDLFCDILLKVWDNKLALFILFPLINIQHAVSHIDQKWIAINH